MRHPHDVGPDTEADWPFDGYPDPYASDERSGWSDVPGGPADPRSRSPDGSSPVRDRHQSQGSAPPDSACDSPDSLSSPPASSPASPHRRSWSFVHVLLVVVPASANGDAIATGRAVCSQLCERDDTVIDRCEVLDTTTDMPSRLVGPKLQSLPPACLLNSPLGQRVFERIVGQTTAAEGAGRGDNDLTAAPERLPVVSAVHETLLYDGDGTGICSVDRFREICRTSTDPVWLVPCLPFVERSSAD